MRSGALAAVGVLLAVASGDAATPRREKPRPAALRIALQQVGLGTVTATRGERSPGGTVYYYVDRVDVLSGSIAGSPPAGAALHALVRRDDERFWVVQPATRVDAATGRWRTEATFGERDDRGSDFDVKVVATRRRLPTGRIPEDALNRVVLAETEPVRAQRRRGDPFVWISSVSGRDVHDGEEMIAVVLESPVEVRAEDMPPDAEIGIAVRPSQTDRAWIMTNRLSHEAGSITAIFGRPGMENYHEFDVIAVMGAADAFPSAGAGIPPQQWREFERRFLARSRPVRVIRWEGAFLLTQVGKAKIGDSSNRTEVEGMTAVRGTIDRPLHPGERIWLVCVPSRGDAWLAGSTPNVEKAGRWVVYPAELASPDYQGRLDLVALVSSNDLEKVERKSLSAELRQTALKTNVVPIEIRSKTSAR